jgi:hypothetical protein
MIGTERHLWLWGTIVGGQRIKWRLMSRIGAGKYAIGAGHLRGAKAWWGFRAGRHLRLRNMIGIGWHLRDAMGTGPYLQSIETQWCLRPRIR